MASFRHCSQFSALRLLVLHACIAGFHVPFLHVTSFQAMAAEPLPVASSVSVTQPGDRNRLTFDLSSPVPASSFVLADPDRVIIDLPEVSFQIDPAVGQPKATASPRAPSRKARQRAASTQGTQSGFSGATLVKAFRFGLFAPGKSRIVIDLAAPATVIKAECEKNSQPGTCPFVIEIAPADKASFRASAERSPQSVRQEEGASGEPDPRAGQPGTRPVIVIDPGHGGIDAGANGTDGTLEKTIVFDFARSLAKKLEESGKYQVILTRKTDVFISLEQRVRIARQAHAALFVSIHADTLSDATSVAGATVYTVSDRASDAEAARIAERENKADQIAGVVDKAEASDVQDILFDLTRRETRAYSHVFARTLVSLWKNVGQLNKNPQRSAGFVVLKAPDVPSVLLELGYLSSEKDAAFLNSGEWRDKTSTTVAEAINSFFAPRESPPKESPTKESSPKSAPAGNGLKERSEAPQGRSDTGQQGALEPNAFRAAGMQRLPND